MAFSGGGDGGGKPLELMLDGERPDPTPVEIIDELKKEIQGIIDRNCLGTS